MARVFVSHAGEDLALAREVHQWLVDAGHEVFLDQDLRDGIPLGEQWEQRLHERLRWANAVVCVVTSAYLASTWCAAEVGIARSVGSQLLPLRAEPGAAHPLLTSFQHTDYAADPPAAQAAVLTALHRVEATWPKDRSPFPGLRPFEADQHRVFFGRANEVEELAELLRSPAERAEGAALLVVGPSGCGKSSLVRAGLLPVMVGEPGWRTLSPILPGTDPVAALARELAAAARRSALDWTVERVHHQLDQRGLTGLVDELLLADPAGPSQRLLIAVDQFEELLTQTAPTERARFAELLRPALTGPVRVVATMRPEFLDQLLLDPALATLVTRTYTLRPLRREALRAVIQRPAQLAGIDVDDGLVDRLVDDTDSGEALPLLAFTLAQLSAGVTSGGRLSSARYDQLGGVQGALTRQADAALTDAVTVGGRSREQVIAGLLRLVTVDEQSRPTRWRVPRDELPTPVLTELDTFVARRLLTTDEGNGSGVIGVAHEAFLSAWPPLAQAITTAASALRARRAVEHAATEWSDNDRPPARLWGGGQLAAALADTGARLRTGTTPTHPTPERGLSRWLPQRHRALVTDRVDLSPKGRSFLHASIRHDRHRRRRSLTVLSVLLVLALTAAGVAIDRQRDAQRQQGQAERQQRIAIARQLIAQADAIRAVDPRTALQLGIAAHHIYPAAETNVSLVNALTQSQPPVTPLTDNASWVASVAFAPDERTLAIGSMDSTVHLWDLADLTQPRSLGSPLTGHADWVTSVAFAPDGRTLVTGGADSTVRLWNLADLTQPRLLGSPLVGHTRPVSSVAFAPDGRTLATGSDDGTVRLWDVVGSAQPRLLGAPLSGHTSWVTSVAFTPDGRILATGGGDSTVRLWDLTDLIQPQLLDAPLNGHTGQVNSVAFAPDGRTLATGSDDGTVLLWDLADLAQPGSLSAPLSGHTDDVTSVAFAPDGRTLATGSDDGTVLLWDLADLAQPRSLGAPLSGHTSPVTSVAFASDGHTLATGDDDGTVLLWDLVDFAQPRSLGVPLAGHTDWELPMAFVRDGRTLATGGDDGTVLLWDLTDLTQPQSLGAPLSGHAYSVTSVAVSPDGRTLATGSHDDTVRLWDLTDLTQPRPLGAPLVGHIDSVTSVTFAPDGRTLATGGDDGTVLLWNLADFAEPGLLGVPLVGHIDSVTSVTFAPDGRTLATGSDDETVRFWDLTDLTQPRPLGAPLSGHTRSVTSVTFAPDGRTLATDSDDGTVLLWDLTDLVEPRLLGAPLSDHTRSVTSVTFAPDRPTLATGEDDGTVRLWDLADLTQPRSPGTPLSGHTDSVTSVTFAPDGRTLATGDFFDTVRLWDLTRLNYLLGHAVERACSIVRGGLDPDEWTRLTQGLPYQDTCPA